MALNNSQLHALVLDNLPDNVTQLISPEKLREVCDEIIDSYFNIISNQENIGLNEYDTSVSYPSDRGVLYEGNLYQANVLGATNPGPFNPLEWDLIDSSSATTANFILKTNGIELDDDKKLTLLPTDSSLSTLGTGMYEAEASLATVGPSNEYPVLGKGKLQVFLGTSATRTLHTWTPFDFVGGGSKTYIRNLSSDWVTIDLSANAQTTYANGIQKIGNEVNLGGQFSNVTLVPQTISSAFNILGSNVAGAVDIDVASTSIKGNTTISRNNNAISVSSSNVFLTSNSEVEIFNLKPSNIATYKSDLFGSLITTADNNIPSFKMVKNYVDDITTGIALGATYVNGLSASTVGTGVTVGLGGNLDSDVNIDLSGSSMSITGSDTRLRLKGDSIVAHKTNEAFDESFRLDINDTSAGLKQQTLQVLRLKLDQ
jgi:hypothetical protein